MTDSEIDPGTPRAIPFYVIQSALEYAEEKHNYAVIRSDNDFNLAETLYEANLKANDLRSSADFGSPLNHTVQVIELQEDPPLQEDDDRSESDDDKPAEYLEKYGENGRPEAPDGEH